MKHALRRAWKSQLLQTLQGTIPCDKTAKCHKREVHMVGPHTTDEREEARKEQTITERRLAIRKSARTVKKRGKLTGTKCSGLMSLVADAKNITAPQCAQHRKIQDLVGDEFVRGMLPQRLPTRSRKGWQGKIPLHRFFQTWSSS